MVLVLVLLRPLVGCVFTLVLVLRQSSENRSKTKTKTNPFRQSSENRSIRNNYRQIVTQQMQKGFISFSFPTEEVKGVNYFPSRANDLEI